MSFSEAVRTCFGKYVTFSGRATRPEYWWFFLFVVLGGLVGAIVDALVFGTRDDDTGPVGSLFSLATLVPSLAVGWRRMHDTGRSGLFLLYPLIVMAGLGTFVAFTGVLEATSPSPITLAILAIGGIVFLISPLLVIWWLTRPSQPGPNDYGPNPKEVTS